MIEGSVKFIFYYDDFRQSKPIPKPLGATFAADDEHNDKREGRAVSLGFVYTCRPLVIC